MNFGMRGHDFDAVTIEQLIEKCQKYSIKHIQLVLKKSISGFKEGMFSEEYATSIGELFRNNGIKIPVLGCYINPSETNKEQLRKNIDYFIENLYYAKYIGAETVGLETGFVGEKLDVSKNDTEEAYQYLLGNIRFLCNKAEEIGVNVAIEGVHCFVINTPQKMKRLLDDLNSDNVKVIFDPVNYLNIDNYKEQTKIYDDFVKLLIDKIAVVHLKDFIVENDDIKYEYPCKGLLDLKSILDIIQKNNPKIPIILEEVNENKVDEVRNNIAEFYKKFLR